MAHPKTPPDKPLDDQVKELLEARRGTWRKIADGSGIVSESWISQFMRGLIPNPGYQTLLQLHSYLKSLPAVVKEPQP